MRKTTGLAGLFMAGALVVGCADDRDEYYSNENIQSDPLLTDPYRTTYPVVPGQTTGAGTPVDKRTGGSIDGRDVTPREQLESGQNVPGDQRSGGTVRPVQPVQPVQPENTRVAPVDVDQRQQ